MSYARLQRMKNRDPAMVRIHNVPPNPSFPHAFSGNPGGVSDGPPIKTFGGDSFWESHLLTQQPFSKDDTKIKKFGKFVI